MSPIAVVLDHTTAGALHDPKDLANEAMLAFYVQASGGLGTLYAPVLALAVADAGRPGVLSHITGLRFITTEPFDSDAARTAAELVRAGHDWSAAHAVHMARPSARFVTGRFLLTLKPDLYEGTGVQAVHPDQ
ncbi:hypothetical protein [Streptomyces blastmyceticus]|uniref:Uncharacterized protein n=1 Tax=Streptomyces blastmyceticus TaxID=68180 RepID=A0ABN0W8P1_9ACTN